MEPTPDLITVFRSTDDTGEKDATEVRDQLNAAGLGATLYEDKDAEAWEVRVPQGAASEAGQILAVTQPETASAAEEVDPSTDLDQVSIYTSEANIGEMEAISIKNLLNAAGIPAFIIGASTLPNLAFEVRVPREHAAEARELVLRAQAAGESAVDEAQATGELNG